MVVITGWARTVAVTRRSCRKLDALFGAAAHGYGVNSPEFGLQFAPSRPSSLAYSDVVTPVHPCSPRARRHENRSETF